MNFIHTTIYFKNTFWYNIGVNEREVYCMIEIRLQEFMREKHYSVTQLAEVVGVSISLISKIKNNQVVITPEFEDKFNRRFSEYKLIGGMPKWKKKYLEVLRENRRLEEALKESETKRAEMEVNYKKIFMIASEPDKSYSVRKFGDSNE